MSRLASPRVPITRFRKNYVLVCIMIVNFSGSRQTAVGKYLKFGSVKLHFELCQIWLSKLSYLKSYVESDQLQVLRSTSSSRHWARQSLLAVGVCTYLVTCITIHANNKNHRAWKMEENVRISSHRGKHGDSKNVTIACVTNSGSLFMANRNTNFT